MTKLSNAEFEEMKDRRIEAMRNAGCSQEEISTAIEDMNREHDKGND